MTSYNEETVENLLRPYRERAQQISGEIRFQGDILSVNSFVEVLRACSNCLNEDLFAFISMSMVKVLNAEGELSTDITMALCNLSNIVGDNYTIPINQSYVQDREIERNPYYTVYSLIFPREGVHSYFFYECLYELLAEQHRNHIGLVTTAGAILMLATYSLKKKRPQTSFQSIENLIFKVAKKNDPFRINKWYLQVLAKPHLRNIPYLKLSGHVMMSVSRSYFKRGQFSVAISIAKSWLPSWCRTKHLLGKFFDGLPRGNEVASARTADAYSNLMSFANKYIITLKPLTKRNRAVSRNKRCTVFVLQCAVRCLPYFIYKWHKRLSRQRTCVEDLNELRTFESQVANVFMLLAKAVKGQCSKLELALSAHSIRPRYLSLCLIRKLTSASASYGHSPFPDSFKFTKIYLAPHQLFAENEYLSSIDFDDLIALIATVRHNDLKDIPVLDLADKCRHIMRTDQEAFAREMAMLSNVTTSSSS